VEKRKSKRARREDACLYHEMLLENGEADDVHMIWTWLHTASNKHALESIGSTATGTGQDRSVERERNTCLYINVTASTNLMIVVDVVRCVIGVLYSSKQPRVAFSYLHTPVPSTVHTLLS